LERSKPDVRNVTLPSCAIAESNSNTYPPDESDSTSYISIAVVDPSRVLVICFGEDFNNIAKGS
jgi:hypothetical protein